MKLLIITQVVDTEHSVLGFFHGWILEFAKQCEQVHVICLFEGTHNFPKNVFVHSLGKEHGASRFTYLYRFFMYIWKYRHEYDAIFVHMNQVYVVLGGLYWRFMGKKIGLWYAHGAVSRSLKLAVTLADLVFTSTPQGLQIETQKKIVVGQGIDFAHFAPKFLERPESSILELVTVGRISASKNISTLLAACLLLKQQGVAFNFSIIGAPLTAEDNKYEKNLQRYCIENHLTNVVTWIGSLNQSRLPEYLQRADIFIHDGATQSLDKVLLEAVAAGCVVVSSNTAYTELTQSIAPQHLFSGRDSQTLALFVSQIKSQSSSIRFETMRPIRNLVESEHGVQGLIRGIVTRYSGVHTS